MKNIDFVNFLLDRPYYLRCKDYFFVLDLFGLKPFSDGSSEYVGSVLALDDTPLFEFVLSVSRRSIRFTSFTYADIDNMVFRPDELIEWSPAILLNCTNYLTFLRYLNCSLSIWLESNPNILRRL